MHRAASNITWQTTIVHFKGNTYAVLEHGSLTSRLPGFKSRMSLPIVHTAEILEIGNNCCIRNAIPMPIRLVFIVGSKNHGKHLGCYYDFRGGFVKKISWLLTKHLPREVLQSTSLTDDT